MGTSLHESDAQDDTYRNALQHLVEILYYRYLYFFPKSGNYETEYENYLYLLKVKKN